MWWVLEYAKKCWEGHFGSYVNVKGHFAIIRKSGDGFFFRVKKEMVLSSLFLVRSVESLISWKAPSSLLSSSQFFAFSVPLPRLLTLPMGRLYASRLFDPWSFLKKKTQHIADLLLSNSFSARKAAIYTILVRFFTKFLSLFLLKFFHW